MNCLYSSPIIVKQIIVKIILSIAILATGKGTMFMPISRNAEIHK